MMRRSAIVVLLALAWPALALAQPALDELVAAYPDHLQGHDGTHLIWKDGTRQSISDGRSGKSFEELLDTADIDDQFAIPYPLEFKGAPALNEDPGRIRNEAFFVKMYGDCRKGEVKPRLTRIPWMPSRGGGTVEVTTVNGVDRKLAAVSRELEKLPAEMTKYLVPSAGTYNCRPIAGTKRLSVHSFGAAIDIATRYGDYWRWAGAKASTAFPHRNRIPKDIAEIFERHGFIWGAKWYHYDTFHFEYRPELIALARKGWPKE
jgi:hypothetical protein